MIAVRKWWTQKYQKPVTSLEWEQSDLENILVEFFEDVLPKDETALRKARVKYTGREIAPTGDTLLDFWEWQVAHGINPDLDLWEDDKAKRRDQKISQEAQRQFEEDGTLLYSAPLPKGIAELEALREARENGNFDSDSYKKGFSLEDIPPDAFDEFVRSASLIK